MKSLTIQIPEQTNEAEIKMLIAATLFENGIFSSGQAADFIGKTKREFLETVGKYGVSVFSETAEDLKKPFHE